MPAVILQPCGNNVSLRHYEDTIENPVDLEEILHLIPSDYHDLLAQIYPDGESLIWGVTPSGANPTKWAKIQDNDIVLFSANNVIFASAIVTLKLHNTQLAATLWGRDESNQTWEYIYFLADHQNLEISVSDFNQAVGYDPAYIIRGFNVLSEERSDAAINLLYGEDADSFDENLIGEALEAIEAEEDADEVDLDGISMSTYRKEQAALRHLLFGNEQSASCCICGREVPVGFLYAAHIKPRSECTLNEKLDLEFIAAPMCKFGCDELYEQGYISVDGGSVVKLFNCSSDAVQRYIDFVEGKECSAWSSESSMYFEWHRNHHSSEE